jgi:hypothetical protein
MGLRHVADGHIQVMNLPYYLSREEGEIEKENTLGAIVSFAPPSCDVCASAGWRLRQGLRFNPAVETSDGVLEATGRRHREIGR